MAESKKNSLFCVIYIGSHALNMCIVEVKNGSISIIEQLRKPIWLGRDSFAMGKISYDSVVEVCDILLGFKRKLQEYSINRYQTIATSALREASNRAYIIEQIRIRTGFDVNVLDNSEERFLNLKALGIMMDGFSEIKNQGTVIVDIGFGSVQVSVYLKGKLNMSHNIKLGSLRVREVLADVEDKTINFHKILEEYIAGTIDGLSIHKKQNISKNFIAIGGEIRLISSICRKKNINTNDSYLYKKDFEDLYNEILYKSPKVIAKDYGISEDSAEILLPSMMMFKKFLDITSSDIIYSPSVTLIDGIILDMAGINKQTGNDTIFEKDILDNAVFIAQRYRYNKAHSEDVEKKALLIFDKLNELLEFGSRERFLLQIAAILHDIGKYIDLNLHYVHSYDLIKASNIIGLSSKELEIVANVARYHSSVIPSKEDGNYNLLDFQDKIKVSKLSAIIRLADALDRSHKQKIDDLNIFLEDDALKFSISTSQDILLEEWSFEKKAEFFKEVFGITPYLKYRRLIGNEKR